MADEDTFSQKPKKLGQGSSLKESLLKGRASITAKPELTEDEKALNASKAAYLFKKFDEKRSWLSKQKEKRENELAWRVRGRFRAKKREEERSKKIDEILRSDDYDAIGEYYSPVEALMFAYRRGELGDVDDDDKFLQQQGEKHQRGWYPRKAPLVGFNEAEARGSGADKKKENDPHSYYPQKAPVWERISDERHKRRRAKRDIFESLLKSRKNPERGFGPSS